MVVVVAAAAAAVAHRGAHPETTTGAMTGATTGAMIEVMIVIMIAMMTENTDRIGADLLLLIITGDTAHDPDHGPTHHVTTEQQERSEFHQYCLNNCPICFLMAYNVCNRSSCVKG